MGSKALEHVRGEKKGWFWQTLSFVKKLLCSSWMESKCLCRMAMHTSLSTCLSLTLLHWEMWLLSMPGVSFVQTCNMQCNKGMCVTLHLVGMRNHYVPHCMKNRPWILQSIMNILSHNLHGECWARWACWSKTASIGASFFLRSSKRPFRHQLPMCMKISTGSTLATTMTMSTSIWEAN